MNEKAMLKKQITELDFALYELALFLDTHPQSMKAMALLNEYRSARANAVAAYEQKFGKYIVTHADVPANGSWKWLEGPWPWEIGFMED